MKMFKCPKCLIMTVLEDLKYWCKKRTVLERIRTTLLLNIDNICSAFHTKLTSPPFQYISLPDTSAWIKLGIHCRISAVFLFNTNKLHAVTNLVYELPFTHHMDSCTTSLLHVVSDYSSHHPLHLNAHTQLIAHSQLNTLITQLSPITRSLKSYYTHYIRPTQILIRSQSIV